MRGIYWIAANQLASQEGLCTMEWVSNSGPKLAVWMGDFFCVNQTTSCLWEHCVPHAVYCHHHHHLLLRLLILFFLLLLFLLLLSWHCKSNTVLRLLNGLLLVITFQFLILQLLYQFTHLFHQFIHCFCSVQRAYIPIRCPLFTLYINLNKRNYYSSCHFQVHSQNNGKRLLP